MARQLFLFWQFAGDNHDLCNLHCPYCYGGQNKTGIDHWNNQPEKWEQAFIRLNRDIYFTLSYGESMISSGFYPILDIISQHSNWECSLITNLTQDPTRMIDTKVAREGRLYVMASLHPMGGVDWELFKKHLLMLRDANIKNLVIYLFYPPQISDVNKYFSWCDDHNIRFYVRRYIGEYAKKTHPQASPKELLQHILSNPKTIEYGLNLHSPAGNKCSAGKDLILVHHDGRVSYCADIDNNNLGNIFDSDFKLSNNDIICPSPICGGDYGLLHMKDKHYPDIPNLLWHDCFVAQTANITGGNNEPVQYPHRREIICWMKRNEAK